MPILYHDGKLCVLLFGSYQNEIYMDIGGHAELLENPQETAQREGKEESANTFDINLTNLVNLTKLANMNAINTRDNLNTLDTQDTLDTLDTLVDSTLISFDVSCAVR